jgi:hypothetical protein
MNGLVYLSIGGMICLSSIVRPHPCIPGPGTFPNQVRDHPLGNINQFHPVLAGIPRFRVYLGTNSALLGGVVSTASGARAVDHVIWEVR